jgi:hypothetical protein
MKWCLKVKLIQHWEPFGELLLGTSSKPIVEQSRRDNFWGAIPDSNGKSLIGSNVLGRLLMDLRERLKRNPNEFSVLSPLPISDFVILGHPIESIERETTHLSESHSSQKRLQLGR